MKAYGLRLLVIGLLTAPAHAALPALEPGLWEILVETTTTPDPNKYPTERFRRCVKPDEAADPRKLLPTSVNREPCRVTSLKEDGAKATYTITCEKNKLTASGEFNFAATAYRGYIVTEMLEAGSNRLQVLQHVTAKRAGPCP